MKINNIHKLDNNHLPGQNEFHVRHIGDSGHEAISQDGPWVRLLSESREAQRMLGEVQDIPEVRAQKVRELRALISSGTYRVSGARVAESVIKETMLGSIL